MTTTTVQEEKILSDIQAINVMQIERIKIDVNHLHIINQIVNSYNAGLEPIREIIQNSLDAFARNIIIQTKEEANENHKFIKDEIAIFADNGIGMNRKKLQDCINFGFSSKGNENENENNESNRELIGNKGVGSSYIYLAEYTHIYTRHKGQTLLAKIRHADLTGETQPEIIPLGDVDLCEAAGFNPKGVNFTSGTIIKTFNLPLFDNNSKLTVRKLKDYILRDTHAGSWDSIFHENWAFPLIQLDLKGKESVFHGFKRIFNEDFIIGFNNRHPESAIDMDSISSYKELSYAIEKVKNHDYKFLIEKIPLTDPILTRKNNSYLIVVIGEGYLLPKPMLVKEPKQNVKILGQKGKRFADTKDTDRGLHIGINGLAVEKIGKNLSRNTDDQENDYCVAYANIDKIELTLNRSQMVAKEYHYSEQLLSALEDTVVSTIEAHSAFRSSLITKDKNSADVKDSLVKEINRISKLTSLPKVTTNDPRIQMIFDLKKDEGYENIVRHLLPLYVGKTHLGMDFHFISDLNAKESNLDSIVVKMDKIFLNEETGRFDALKEDYETLEIEYSLMNFKDHGHSLKTLKNIVCFTLGEWSVNETKTVTDIPVTLRNVNGIYYARVDFPEHTHDIQVYVLEDVIRKENELIN